MHNKQLVTELVDKMPGPTKDTKVFLVGGCRRTKDKFKYFSSWLDKQLRIAIRQVKPNMVEDKSKEKPRLRYRRTQGAVNVADGEKKNQEILVQCVVASHMPLTTARASTRRHKMIDGSW